MLTRNRLAALFIIMTAGVVSCSDGKNSAIEVKEQPVAVTVATASLVAQESILASGQVEALQTADISTRVMGRITNIFVKAGDHVTKGQVLCTINDEDIRARSGQMNAMIAEAEAAVVSAQKDYDRLSVLYSQQSATGKELDVATLQFKSAKAKLDAAKEMEIEVNVSLSYSRLTAPFTGVVARKLAEVGNIASPGVSLLTVEKDEDFQVSASVAESDISRVHLGDAAVVQIKSTETKFIGRVVQINPSSQFTGGQYLVKISIPRFAKTGVYSGMFVSVYIPLKPGKQEENIAVLVPSGAIVIQNDLKGIYTVSLGNTALLRWVRLGRIYGDKIEVLSGLSKQEKFICASDGKLFDGASLLIKDSIP